MESNNVSLVEDSVHPKSTTSAQQTQPTQSQTSPLTQRQQQASATSPPPPPHAGSELVHTTPVVASTVNLPPLGMSVLPGLGPNSNNNNSNAIASKGAGQPRTNHHHHNQHAHAIGIQPSPSPSPPPTNNTTTQTHNPSHLQQQQHNGQPPQFLQQPITFIFERFCSNVPPGPLSLHTPLPSPQMVVRSVMDSTMDVLDAKSLESNVTPSSSPQNLTNANTTTTTTTTFHHHPYPYQSPQTHPHTCNNSDTTNTTTNNSNTTTTNHNGVVLKKNNKKKRKQQHQQLQTQQLPQYSYRTPIDSPNSMQAQDDSRSEESYVDNMLTDPVGRCEDYDLSPVESLKRLLLLFPAMSHTRLGAILPVLLDNDIDDPEILLLIENENFLRDLRGKNGSEISRGNCLLLWHGIQEHQRLNASSVHTPKSCSSSASYSPPPPLMLLPHAPRAKRPKLELHGEKDDSASSIISTSSQDSDHHGHVHDHLHHKRPVNHHHLQGHQSNGGNAMTGITRSAPTINTTNNSTKQRVKAPKLSMSTIEEVHSRVDRVLSVVALENERRKHSHLARNPQTQPSLKFEDFVAELKHAHKIPVAFGTLRDMRFAYILKKLNEQKYKELLASNKGNVTEFYRTCQEVCEESFVEDELEGALPWLELKSKLYYK